LFKSKKHYKIRKRSFNKRSSKLWILILKKVRRTEEKSKEKENRLMTLWVRKKFKIFSSDMIRL
jgi:hypothetical protein